MDFLGKELVGFVVDAPLTWGMETRVNGDPAKHTTVDVSRNTPRKDMPVN